VKTPQSKLVKLYKDAVGKKVYASVQQFANDDSPWEVLMVASGAFLRPGMALGETRSVAFLKATGLYTADLAKFEELAAKPELLAKKLKGKSGFGAETVMLLGLGMPAFVKFVKALG